MKPINYLHRLARTAACIVLLFASVHLAAQTAAPAQHAAPSAPTGESETLTFTFAPASDLFTLRGNEAQLAQLFSAVDRHRDAITSGRMPIAVDGYCASQPTPAENLRTAYLRATRVKSELITAKGLTEAAFVTANYATAYGEQKDVVVVTLRIPAAAEPQPQPAKEQPDKQQPRKEEPRPEASPRPEPAQKQPAAEPASTKPDPAAQPDAASTTAASTSDASTEATASTSNAPYCLALRTNLLYDAFLLPTLGIEWRINESLGIKLDGSLSRWGGSTGKVQKMWLLNPEVRWYLLSDKRFYLGASATYGEYNVYGYPLGNLLRDDTGYQGTLWNAGLTLGYQLRLCRALSLDFNLGLGYTRSEYDSFTMTDRTRVYRQRNRTKTIWGPTQAGISLVWIIGGKKQ